MLERLIELMEKTSIHKLGVDFNGIKGKQPLKYAADFISKNGIDKYIVLVYNSIEIR